jgi:Fur family transcriptional regulator, zinc uptake regulator
MSFGREYQEIQVTNVIHCELRFALRRPRRTDADLLRYAERLCEDMRVKLTPGRRRVLKELIACDRPVAAYELMERLGSNGGTLTPHSVHRPLALFVQLGIVRRLATQNTYVVVRDEPSDEAVPVMLICTDCGSVRERSYSALEQALYSERFQVHGALEVQGICESCQTHGR